MTTSSPSIWHLLHNEKKTVKIFSFFVAFLENLNFTGYSFWDRLRNFFHKFTRIVLSVHKLNKVGKFWLIYGQLLNIMSSYGWYGKKLWDRHKLFFISSITWHDIQQLSIKICQNLPNLFNLWTDKTIHVNLCRKLHNRCQKE